MKVEKLKSREVEVTKPCEVEVRYHVLELQESSKRENTLGIMRDDSGATKSSQIGCIVYCITDRLYCRE